MIDLRNVPISAFLAYLAQGWRLSEKGGVPAYQDTHHGRHGVLLVREVSEESINPGFNRNRSGAGRGE